MSNVLPECMRCDFFEPQDDIVGDCRRRSPRPLIAADLDLADPDAMMALWPVVAQDDWCGEFVEASRNRSVRNQSLMHHRLQDAQARLASRETVEDDPAAEEVSQKTAPTDHSAQDQTQSDQPGEDAPKDD